MSKKILFITTANLSMKPRLVKEIQLAQHMGFEIDLIAFKINNWTDENHDKIATNLNIKNFTLYATKQDFTIWFFASILHIVAAKMWLLFPKNTLLSAFSSNKRTIMLWAFLLFKPQFKNYKLIIGRNTATIFPILFFKKRFQGAIGFDVEDYHPGENVKWDNPIYEKNRRILLMQKIFEHCSYVSFAGEPIMKQVQNNLKIPTNIPRINIPNSFSSKEFPYPKLNCDTTKINLIWFSVDISSNRGLEELIEALKDIHEDFHITLYGTRIESFYQEWIAPNQHFITVKSPLSQSLLHKQLHQYDIGMALEMSKTDINKQLAISNKLYAYIQSGLYTLATNTIGHEHLLKNHPGFGLLCGQTPFELKQSLLVLKDNIAEIRDKKTARYEKGKDLAWENESYKLVEIWKQLGIV